MSWRTVAAKDVRDATRSRSSWLLTSLLVATVVTYSFAHGYVGERSFTAFMDGLADLVGGLVPLVAVLLAYKSIVEERTGGSLVLTLSFPHTRRDVLLGTFLGRALVVLAPTVGALVVAGGLGMVRYGTDGALAFPWLLVVTVLYGLAFVGFALGLSASTTVDRWITLGALGGYLVLVLVWDDLVTATLLVLHRFQFEVLADVPDWALLFQLLQPRESYLRLLRAGFEVQGVARYLGDGAPVYVDWWMGLVLLLAWTVVPLAAGYWRFERADL